MNWLSWLRRRSRARRHHRLRVDQVLRQHVLQVDDRHALARRLLDLRQAHANLVLQQLAHAPHAAVAKVVDVVDIDLFPPPAWPGASSRGSGR
jgi:hypothetical protein